MADELANCLAHGASLDTHTLADGLTNRPAYPPSANAHPAAHRMAYVTAHCMAYRMAY